MEPTYFEGDRVLTFNWGNLNVGSVVVFKFRNKYVIKRVEKILKNQVVVKGENKFSSKYPPIDLRQVIGRVVLKY